jgi:hypothetical protein
MAYCLIVDDSSVILSAKLAEMEASRSTARRQSAVAGR